MKKIYISLVVVALIALGGYFFPKLIEAPLGASPVGTQFGVQKIASKAWDLSNRLSTTTSILNTDRENRIIQGSFIACDGVGTSFTAYTGAGLAGVVLKAATTTTDAPSIVSNTNLVANSVAVATSSPWVLATGAAPSGSTLNWPSGSYLSFWSNATNTALCTVGVSYVQK